MSLAAFNITKKRDADGKEITPPAEYGGLLIWYLFHLLTYILKNKILILLPVIPINLNAISTLARKRSQPS